MKKKQILLKKLAKEKIPPQQMLKAIDWIIPMLGIEEIANHFVETRDHQKEMYEIDPQLLDIIFPFIIEKANEVSEESDQQQKIDVLTFGEKELLAFCKEKELVSLHEYCQTIKHKSHREHSYYGYMLVKALPDEFFIGPKCTHYHCKTTAQKIERQYGIYNEIINSDAQPESLPHESDSEFINNEDVQHKEESGIRIKKKKKIRKDQKKKKVKEQSEESVKEGKKTRMKDLLNSDSQSNQGTKKVKERNKKQSKMDILNQEQGSKKQKQLIHQALEQLELHQIIQTLDYSDLFEFLCENHKEKLMPLIDIMTQVVLFNKKQAKRLAKSEKKNKSHSKRLAKAKINLKEITLENLVTECSKNDIISEEDLKDWENKYQPEDHPKLAYELLQAEPNGYVIQGAFSAYIEKEVNAFFESVYQSYQQNKEGEQDDEQSLNEQEDQDQEDQQEGGEQADSNYSIDSDQDKLGIV